MKASSNRNFGIVFFVFFLIISLFPLLKDNHINYWFFSISVVLLILGILNSKLLTPLNIIWFKLGILLARIVSPVVMGLIFFIVITPISIIMKIIGKDVLNLKKSDKDTYWIKKMGQKSKMKNQF